MRQAHDRAVGPDNLGGPTGGHPGQFDFGEDWGWRGRRILAQPAAQGGEHQAVSPDEFKLRHTGLIIPPRPGSTFRNRGVFHAGHYARNRSRR